MGSICGPVTILYVTCFRCVTRFPCKSKATKVRCDSVASLVLLVTNSAATDNKEFPMVLLQKRDEKSGLLAGLWECPTIAADEAAPAVELAAALLALARQAPADGGDMASLLACNLKTLTASDVRPVGAPFVHMFSHIHRSVRVFGAVVDVHSPATMRRQPPATTAGARPHNSKAQLHSISRLAAAGIPSLTRKILANAAAALGFVL